MACRSSRWRYHRFAPERAEIRPAQQKIRCVFGHALLQVVPRPFHHKSRASTYKRNEDSDRWLAGLAGLAEEPWDSRQMPPLDRFDTARTGGASRLEPSTDEARREQSMSFLFLSLA